MIDSIAFYAGAGAAFAGAIGTLRRRTRRKGAIIFASGIAVAAAALAWPVPALKHATGDSLLDRNFSKLQFDELHEIEIAAPPQQVYDAMRAVTANEILLFRTLTAIRRFGRPLPKGILNAPKNEPLLDVATRTSFKLLADAPPRELVVGTVVIRPRLAVAGMNFLITPIGEGRCRLTTETRVYATTPSAARRFATYWRIIHPGSDIIRRMWLRAIRKRAENPSPQRHRGH